MKPPKLDRKLLRQILDSVPAMVWIIDPNQAGLYVSNGMRDFTGILVRGAADPNWHQLIHPDDRDGAQAVLKRHMSDLTPCMVDVRLRRHDGQWRWIHARIQPLRDKAGNFRGMIGVNTDVTEAREREQALAHLVTHDKLTGLPNRTMLLGLIETAIEKARVEGRKLPVLTFGVDRFQAVNETLGHGAGDALLGEVGRRLTAMRHGNEIVGHLSGNRFVLIAENSTGTDSAYRAADRLIDVGRVPLDIDDTAHELTGSVGIAIYPDDAEDAVELMSAAEAALQMAKQLGGNHLAFFDRQQHGQARSRFDLELDLRRGIPRGELVVYFQPKVALPAFRLVGFEALVRWQHPERGLLQPAEFVGLAEDAGLIGPLTHWVFDAVARQLGQWIDAGLTPVPIAVNVSPREFLHGLMDEHLPAYQAHNLPDGLLEIEITESTMIDDFERVCTIVETLHAMGIKVAMDDFGTGYSSLASLNRLPIACLKIDRAFTQDIHWDRSSRAVASAIISIARELGLEVVAEGVETQAQLKALRALRCQVVQGYLTGHPVAAEDATVILSRGTVLQPGSGVAQTGAPPPRPSSLPAPPA